VVMFRGTFQSGYLSLLYSGGSDPLQLWTRTVVGEGTISIVDDDILAAPVVELRGQVPEASIVSGPLGITLPILVLQIRPIDMHHVSFEVALTDGGGVRRRLRASTFQSTVRSKTAITTMPLVLDAPNDWNLIVLDLTALVRRAYGSTFSAVDSVQLHAACRLRRIFFAERVPQEWPAALQLYRPFLS